MPPGPPRAIWPRRSVRGLAKAAVIASVNGDRARPRLGRWPTATTSPSSSRRATGASTRSATRPPTCWPRPCSTCSRGPPSPSGRRSRTASTTTSSCPAASTFTPDDLERLDARMREIIAERQPFVRDEIPEAEALELFRDHPYKLEIIEGQADDPMSATETGLVRTYDNPPQFIDLCRGPHVPDTGRLGHFKLMRVAGAYWRGDEKNPMLQRIYGTAWASKKDLAAYLAPPGGGREARSPQARRRARPVLVPRRDRLGPGRLPPQGRPRPPADGGLQPRSATSRPATSSSTRPTSPRRTCSRRRATSTGSPTACSRRWSSTGAPTTTSSR